MAGGATTRRMRVFRRWMRSFGVECSEALDLVDSGEEGIWVRALCPLQEGDLVATIPKEACLTIQTSGARDIIHSAGLDGSLGLAVALIFERSLGESSPWHGYLQLLPYMEDLPVVWPLYDVDRLLLGTELHKAVKDDKKLLHEDWKENIQPLIAADNLKFSPEHFGVEQYFAAKSLVTSRSFQIDDFHGSGMAPLADLFNHKTGDEDVHFTSICSVVNHEGDDGDNRDDDDDDDDENAHCDHDSVANDKSSVSDADTSSGDDPTKLEMIIVQDVEAGAELYPSPVIADYGYHPCLHSTMVFNTYGSMGNAALLHRYGFTEPENPYDIVNIDIQIIDEWSTVAFSSRHFRRRLLLWRKLNYSGSINQKPEYFEITFDGEPELELLVLLYILYLDDGAYQNLDTMIHSFEGPNDSASRLIMSAKAKNTKPPDLPECMREFLLTRDVCHALVSLANARESCYGADSLEEDWNKLRGCCCVGDKKLYHSLVLRISERTILSRLRDYASKPLKEKKNL